MVRRRRQWVEDKLALPKIFLLQNQSTEQRPAARCPLPSVPPTRYAKRSVYAKDFGIDTFLSGGAADALS